MDKQKIVFLTTKEENPEPNQFRYSTIAVNLPGVGGCGDTEEASLQSAILGAKTAIEVYNETGMAIPWENGNNHLEGRRDSIAVSDL